MKKIAIYLADLRGGGAERVAVNLANSFIQRGYAVDMVLHSAFGVFLSDLHPDIRIVDLKVKRIRGVFLPLVRYLRDSKPDALFASMWPLTVLAILARTFARVSTRVVVTEHTTWSRSELLGRFSVGWQVRSSMHYLFPKADAVVAVSQGAASDLARFANLDRKTITVIYNPIVDEAKPSVAPPLSPLAWWTGSHLKLLAVGTLKEIKDFSTLLRAFALLRKQRDARLLILGEGECRSELEALARQLGINGDVFMPGFVKENLTSYYQQADLFVLSSTGEGFGNVVVEALAAGTPVVSTDCPSGPREILCDGKFGRLVPLGDAQALAIAMEESLSAQHDTAALMARAQYFSIDKAVDEYLTLLFPQTASKDLA